MCGEGGGCEWGDEGVCDWGVNFLLWSALLCFVLFCGLGMSDECFCFLLWGTG